MAPSLDRDPGGGEPGGRAAAEDVLLRTRPLVRARIELLRAEVGAARHEGLEEGWIVRCGCQHLECERAVEVQQMVARRGVEVVRPGDPVEAEGAGEWAGALREPAHAEVIESIERNAAVGRELAAGDADHAGRPGREDGLALRARGAAFAAGQHAEADEGGPRRAEATDRDGGPGEH